MAAGVRNHFTHTQQYQKRNQASCRKINRKMNTNRSGKYWTMMVCFQCFVMSFKLESEISKAETHLCATVFCPVMLNHGAHQSFSTDKMSPIGGALRAVGPRKKEFQ
jgi:hypothetical protein